MPAPLTLRTSLTPDLMNLPSQDFVNNYATHDLAGSSSLRRGWVSAGMSSDGSDMLFQAAEAYKSGDAARGAALEQQGRDMMARSQQWAPSVQDFTDIQSADDLGTWLGGQVGNLRTSVPPVLGGLGGAAAGGLGGALVGGLPGAVAGATWGSRLGAGLLGYQGERNEAAAQAMMDDEIRRTRTYDDILSASRTKGAAAGALESIVPGGLAKAATVGLGKAAAKQGAKALIGKEVAKNAGEEFLTEGAQELTGQAAQNWLKQDDLTNFDYTDAFNAGMGGLVGGGVMGGAGAAMQVGRNALAGETTAPTQEVDPNKSKLDAVLDKTVELAGKAGSKVGALAERYTNPHAEFLRTATTDPKDLTDEQVVDMYKGSADKLADAVLTNPQQYRNEEIQAAAAKYKQDGDWSTFRAAILGNERKSKMSEMLTDFDNGAKNSEMSTPFGDQMGKLSEAWLSNEGKKYKHVFDDSDDAKLLGKKLFGWIASDFGAQHNKDDDGNPQHFIPKTLVRELGDRAADVISNAIAAARKEGVPVDNQRANAVLKELRTTLKDESHDTGLLTGALKYTAERSWTPKMLGQLARELRQSGGKLDKEDRSWFESQFNDADDLLKRFAEPSKSEYYKAKNELKTQRYEDAEAISQSGGLEEEEANNADSPDSGHDSITDNDGDWNSGIQQIEDRAKRTFRSLDRDGTPYDTADPEQNALFTSKLSTLQNDPAVFVKPIGIWRRVRDAAKGNAALLREYEDDLLRAHGNDLAVEGTFHGELNPEDLTAAERVTLLGKINRRFKTIEVEGVEPAKDPHKIPKGEIASFRVDAVTKGDGPKRRDMGAMRAKDGFLFLERVISGKTSYFPTTVSRLLMHMRGRGDWAGAANIDKEVQVAGKDKGAALALSHLEQALADLITSDATFTGRIGYLADGKEQRPIMLDQKAKLPKELPLGEGMTVATAMRRRASEARWGWSDYEENTNSEGHTQEPYVEPKLIAGQDDGGNKIVSGVNVVDDFGNLKNNIGDRAADRKIVHGAKEGASKAVTQLRTREKFHTKTAVGGDVTTKAEAGLLLESLRDGLAGELSVVNRDGKWGVLQKTQEQSRDQGVVSEVDEMSSGSAERFEKTIREFQEETGLSLEVNVPDGLRTFAGNVIRNARVAYRLATEQEKGRLGKLIAARRFRSANLLSDTIRNKREEVPNERVVAAGGGHPGGGASSSGRHTGASGTGGVLDSGEGVPDAVLGRAGMDSQDRKADGNRNAGKGVQGQRASVTKQDAWVMKIASMSMKDMKAAIRALPAEKLDAAFDLLETFFPVDNSNPFWQRNNLDNFDDKMFDVLGEAQDVLRDRLDEDAKNSEQNPAEAKLNADEAVEFLKRAFGKDFDAEVVADLGGKAGTWKPGLIRMAAAAPNGVQYHEALHEFFNQLKQHGSDNVRALIERVASNPIMIRKLERLLEKHPKAQAQLKTPEEAAAFMYQFHQLGLLNVGPETSTLFGKIAKLIANAAKALRALVDTEYRDTRNKEKSEQADIDAAFKALSLIGSGALAEADSKQAILDALRANVEAHDKVLENLGKGVDDFHRKVGKMVMSTEAMMELTRDKGLIEVMRAFHQKAGTAMLTHESKGGVVSHGGFSEAVHAETGRWLNRLDNLLRGVAKEDIALAMPYLEAGTVPTDKVVADIVSKVRKFNSDIFQALTDADIRRLEISEKGEPKWVPMEARRNYFSQVWDVDSLIKDPDGFVKKLLDKHRDELERIAKASNAEIEAYRAGEEKLPAEGTAARAEIDRVTSSNTKYQDVTPEMVAEAIYGRLINSGGLADLEENEASMGITPGAAAINRRSLTWLDPETFSEYKSKDLVNIMTTYTRSMIKRAEYQKRFGYGGEKITDAVDMAFLRQLGGEELASYAEAALPAARKEWRKAAAEWYEKTKEKYPEPFPTLRLIGLDHHRAEVGVEEHAKAVIAATKAMEPAVNGIKALEGTLGADASQTAKTINSWMVTYTNLRTLPLMLFTNISDVIGLTVQGGNLSDAWNAFVTGMREVRNTWVGEKDRSTTRGEMWGAVDAGSWMDSLGQGYGSAFMTSGAKKINDKFFKMVGAEGWNRGVRAVAATVAERLILDWVKNGVDFKNAAEKARFERLYGEGFKPENIALDPDGNLDINDARNRAAVNRWVMDAVMTSNAAHRPIWASDPRFQTFIHLKNFAYTFHRVMLKGIIEQAKLGNYRPALVALTGYAPVAIASGAVKEMLIPGEEPPWMQGGLDGYLDYGIGQANLLGVPQMYWNSATDPARALGPIYDQVQNLISVPLPKVGFMDERALDEELVKALPGGNVLSRAVKD